MSAANNKFRDLLQGTIQESGAVSPDKSGAQQMRPFPQGTSAETPLASKGPEYDALMAALLDRAAPLYVTDTSGKLVSASNAFRELAPLLFKTKGHEKLRSIDDTPPGLMDIIERLYVDGEEIRRSDTVKSDGEANTEDRYFISRHFSIKNTENTLIGFAGIYEDVTSLSQANQKAGEMESWLQDVIRSSSDWLWTVDHNFNLTFITHRVSEILNVPAQVFQGRHLFTLGEFDSENSEIPDTKKDMENFRPFRNRPFLMPTEQGDIRYVHLSGVPIFNEISGRFEGFRGTGTDVTRRFKAEKSALETRVKLEDAFEALRNRNEELAGALEQSQVADKAKMDFLAMMSHELRTPPNCIIRFSDAAIKRIHGPLDTAYSEYFSSIHEAGSHLLGIISDILDTANIENSEVSIETTPVRICDLVTEATSMVRPKASGKDLNVVMGDIPNNLIADMNRLRGRQILVNLLGNAIKFTPDHGSIGIDVSERQDGHIAITVWDTGIGIPDAEKKRIFDRFYRVDKNIFARGIEGTGLGLNISRHLARLMGGEVIVESAAKGARLTFLLSLKTH